MEFPTHIIAVGGIVEDGLGNILLVKTRDGGWVYPGGQVEVGENLIDACSREIREESGIETTVCYLIGVHSNTSIHKWYDGATNVPTKLMFDFVCKPLGGDLSTSDETTDSRWVPKDQVLDHITAPAIRTRYQSYLDYEGATYYSEYVTSPEFEVKVGRSISK